VPPGLDALTSLVAYEGPGRRLVMSLKYANRRSALAWMTAALAAQATVTWGPPDPAAVVTWVPASAARRRRGYDQAELLARRTARALGLPCRRLLVRGDDAGQTGRSRLERMGAPRMAATSVVDGPVVVVDDVCTTGATLAAAAGALRAAGAAPIRGLTVARTAPRGDAGHRGSSRGAVTPKEVIHAADSKNR
jgi:predicted amidophosphoribosyltransferase